MDSIEHIDDFFSVVFASIIVGSILFASDQLLGMKELAAAPRTHLI